MTLDADARATLLRAARDAIRARVVGTPEQREPRELRGPLAEPRGCFVTLHRAGELRGCIGLLSAEGPLADGVRAMAVAAATRDPRFPPIHADELPELDVEISVLTPSTLVAPADVVVGRDGLIVERGHRRGVLLPQVATDHGLDARRFVEATCEKAGLPRDAWRDPETRLYAFSAEVFGDDD